MHMFTYAAHRPEVPRETGSYPGRKLRRFVEAGIKAGAIIGDPRLQIDVYDAADGDRAGDWFLTVGNVNPVGRTRDLDGVCRNVDEFSMHDPDDEIEEYVRAIFERVVEDANDLLTFGGDC